VNIFQHLPSKIQVNTY